MTHGTSIGSFQLSDRSRSLTDRIPISRLWRSLAVSLAFSGSTTAISATPFPVLNDFIGPSSGAYRPVQNCDDAGFGSLREVIGSIAQSGDIVDLSQLNCSAITLTSGEIPVAQDDLTILGSDSNSIVISGNDSYRVFNHTGYGTLEVSNLIVAHGYAHETMPNGVARGGCISSAGSVLLRNALIRQCEAFSEGANGSAQGGAIYAKNEVSMARASVFQNSARSVNSSVVSFGGGIQARSLNAKYSSIEGNVVDSQYGGGGSAELLQSASLIGSTIEANSAPSCGAIRAYGTATIVNSTISSNVTAASAVCLVGAGDKVVAGNTIAFNSSTGSVQPAAAIYINGQIASSNISVSSSIIAANEILGTSPFDLYVKNGQLSGADNLIVTSNQSPPGFITTMADPKLGPLQFNGGWTRTHALRADSPAIGAGSNPLAEQYDQRGSGYPRATGPAAKVDIGAFQFDSVFAHAFE